ncbi:hypothetical protein QAD02_006617 [Eretmocerus hayati]|uniref:Uncharacterized protein n=1 Tax=Eretmocerus hayati TaxID=131215 RepID=A0ACC2N1C5_9HYME|nr:hypothetical protein QAD02_006617 [Eretmocerus hayati]
MDIVFLAKANKIVIHSVEGVVGAEHINVAAIDVENCDVTSSQYSFRGSENIKNRVMELGDGFGVVTTDGSLCSHGINRCIIVHDENGKSTEKIVNLAFDERPTTILPILNGSNWEGLIVSGLHDYSRIVALHVLVSNRHLEPIETNVISETLHVVLGEAKRVTLCGDTSRSTQILSDTRKDYFIRCNQFISDTGGIFRRNIDLLVKTNKVLSMEAHNLGEYGFLLLTAEHDDDSNNSYLKLLWITQNEGKKVLFNKKLESPLDKADPIYLRISENDKEICSHFTRAWVYKNLKFFIITSQRVCEPKTYLLNH